MAVSQTSVTRLYLSVIEDVINGVRESFLDEGVDEQVLQELKQIWENKVQSSKALDHSDGAESHGPNRGGVKLSFVNKKQADHADADVRPEQLYPVQITLPAQQNSGETASRVLTIQVPESAIAGNQLQTVLTGPLIAATLALPTHLATNLLQQHVTAALSGQQAGNSIASRQLAHQSANPSQLDGQDDGEPDYSLRVLPLPKKPSSKKKPRIVSKPGSSWQLDGGLDSSDDEDEEEDDDDDDADGDDAENENEEGEGDEGPEEEPLNSEDDVSEEDVSDILDTENVVVCQYDKITRSRNKWKFYLKDGVMNLKGKDYVFQKSNGDAEW